MQDDGHGEEEKQREEEEEEEEERERAEGGGDCDCGSKNSPSEHYILRRGIKCRTASSLFPLLLCFRQSEQTLSHP